MPLSPGDDRRHQTSCLFFLMLLPTHLFSPTFYKYFNKCEPRQIVYNRSHQAKTQYNMSIKKLISASSHRFNFSLTHLIVMLSYPVKRKWDKLTCFWRHDYPKANCGQWTSKLSYNGTSIFFCCCKFLIKVALIIRVSNKYHLHCQFFKTLM